MKRDLQEHKVIGAQFIDSNCLVCGKDNPIGYHTQFLNLDDGRCLAIFKPHHNLQSYPDRLHGGVSCTLMDELLSRAIQVSKPKQLSVTLDLKVRFRAPLPLNGEICAVSWIVKDRAKTYDAAGEVILPDGTVALEATGRYLKVAPEEIGSSDNGFFEDTRPYPQTVMV